jgi:hypothetical protein
MAAQDRAVTLKQFARLLDVSPGYITELKQAERLVLDDKGRVLVDASRARIRDTADPAKDGVRARHAAGRKGGGQDAGPDHDAGAGGHAGGSSIGSTYQAARAVKERYLAMEAKRAYEQAIGKLMDASHVEAAVIDAVSKMRARLELLASTLGPELASISSESACAARIAEAVEYALEETARQFNALCKSDHAA